MLIENIQILFTVVEHSPRDSREYTEAKSPRFAHDGCKHQLDKVKYNNFDHYEEDFFTKTSQ